MEVIITELLVLQIPVAVAVAQIQNLLLPMQEDRG